MAAGILPTTVPTLRETHCAAQRMRRSFFPRSSGHSFGRHGARALQIGRPGEGVQQVREPVVRSTGRSASLRIRMPGSPLNCRVSSHNTPARSRHSRFGETSSSHISTLRLQSHPQCRCRASLQKCSVPRSTAQNILNAVERRFDAATTLYGLFRLPMDADGVLGLLKGGLRYEQLMQEGTIPF